MKHRERVLKAINHEETDRVPIDLGATVDTSIVKEAYDQLRKYLKMKPTDPVLIHKMMRVVEVDDDILDYFQTDVRGVFPRKPERSEQTNENTYKDEWGVVRTKFPGIYYYEEKEFPLSGNISQRDIINYKWPDPDDPNIVKGLKEQVKKIKDNCDCAIVLNLPPCIIHQSQYLRGFYDWFLDCGMNVKLIETLFDVILEINKKIVKNLLSEVGKEVDLVIIADDLGTQRGLQVSPDFFRKSIKPRFKEYFNVVHQFSPDLKIIFHSCGSIEAILDDMIEVGIDILNPVQPLAKNMDTANLKKKYGDRLSFWGAIDAQYALCNEDPEVVKREVEQRIRDLGKGGGYVLSGVHNIQPGVPPENIVAMFEHGKEFSKNYFKR